MSEITEAWILTITRHPGNADRKEWSACFENLDKGQAFSWTGDTEYEAITKAADFFARREALLAQMEQERPGNIPTYIHPDLLKDEQV